jgi:hypothetical protein
MVFDTFYFELKRELEDTLSREQRALKNAQSLPKGSLFCLKKANSSYYYLKAYQNHRVVSSYLGSNLTESQIAEFQNGISSRRALEKDIKMYKQKAAILDKAIKEYEKRLSI